MGGCKALSARDIFLDYGDFLWDFFCSPTSGNVIGIAGVLFITYAVHAYIKAITKESRKKAERVNPDNSTMRGDT